MDPQHMAAAMVEAGIPAEAISLYPGATDVGAAVLATHCTSPEPEIAKAEYMFSFVSVVECPQQALLDRIGPTLVCSAITDDEAFQRQLVECTHIDRSFATVLTRE